MSIQMPNVPASIKKEEVRIGPKVIVADLDGVLINSAHRTGHFFSGRHAEYYDQAKHDTPIPQGAYIYRQFANDPDYRMIYITSRWDIPHYRETTINQIRMWVDFRTDNSQLLMRPRGVSYQDLPDAELKPLLLQNAGYSFADVFMAFDDRRSVIEMWRRNGVICYESQDADY